MARLTLTERYSDLNDWPGRLFEAEGTTVFTARSSTKFSFTYPASHDFADFRVVATGIGFSYAGGLPTAGNISKVVVYNGSGQAVLTFDNFTSGTLASSLSQFSSSIFGSRNTAGNGPSPDGEGAWSMLLSGKDVIIGTEGNDRRGVEGFNSGNDTFRMLGGDDYVEGGIGNDTILGGAGVDEISFRQTTYNTGNAAFQGISVNMTTGKLTDCWGGTDTFSGIERITGSRFDDIFVGSAGRDEFVGLRGNDTFRGGADQDRVRYDSDDRQGGHLGIAADLETSKVGDVIRGVIRDGFGNRDVVIDIERVNGTRYNDRFVGSSERNAFGGGEGRDFYNGMGGGDAVNFDNNFSGANQTGIIVNLQRGTNQIRNDGYGNVETAVSIEEIWGSLKNDRIIMTGADNFIFGKDGADIMTGAGGNDRFAWENGNEFGDGDRITDFDASGAANIDELLFEVGNFANMTTTLRLVNGTQATAASGVGQFVFNAANDTLYWDRNGSAAGGSTAVVVLQDVDALSAANFDLLS